MTAVLYPHNKFDLDDIVDVQVLFFRSNQRTVFKLGQHVFEVTLHGVILKKDLSGVTFECPRRVIVRKNFCTGQSERCDYNFMTVDTNCKLATINYYAGHFTCILDTSLSERDVALEKFLPELQTE